MPEGLERRHYQLSVIRETAAELARLRHPGSILEAFLMSAQGGVGALGGFAALTAKDLVVTHLVVRGDPGITYEDIRALLKDEFDPGLAGVDRFPFFLSQNKPLRFWHRFTMIIACPLGDDRMAIVGLAPAMHGQDYDSEDRDLIMGLSCLFQISLNAAFSSTRVELLNAELQKRNTELDRQVFHLNGFRELSMEAGEAVTVETFLDVFLPTLLGRFLRHQGLVVVHDKSSGSAWLKSMGITPEPSLSSASDPSVPIQAVNTERLLFLCLSGVGNKHLQPQQTEPVLSMDSLLALIQGFRPETAFLFMVRAQMYGAVLLGSPLEDRVLSSQEKELLLAFVSQSVLHMKNADSFQTIVALNTDLEHQNEALRMTIDDLTQAKHRIGVLEAAARRVTQMVTRNAERILQVRPLDFILIIGISLVLATLFNIQNPKGIRFFPLPKPAGAISINAVEATRMVAEEGALLIDARPREFYEKGHVEGALNVTPALFDTVYKARFSDEDLERPLIIYGRSFSRLYDEAVVRKFLSWDHERVYLVEGNGETLMASGGGK